MAQKKRYKGERINTRWQTLTLYNRDSNDVIQLTVPTRFGKSKKNQAEEIDPYRDFKQNAPGVKGTTQIGAANRKEVYRFRTSLNRLNKLLSMGYSIVDPSQMGDDKNSNCNNGRQQGQKSQTGRGNRKRTSSQNAQQANQAKQVRLAQQKQKQAQQQQKQQGQQQQGQQQQGQQQQGQQQQGQQQQGQQGQGQQGQQGQGQQGQQTQQQQQQQQQQPNNPKNDGKNGLNKRERGQRAGQERKKQPENNVDGGEAGVEAASYGKKGAIRTFSPLQIGKFNPDSAKKSAAILGELIGKSELKTQYGFEVDVEELMVRLEVGGNPIPPLKVPSERSIIRVAITPDCSPSTSDWNGLACSWAIFLSGEPNVDITYIRNSNGASADVPEEEFIKVLKEMDLVIYLGDTDGKESCEEWAKIHGITVIGLCDNGDRYAKQGIMLEKKIHRKGRLIWANNISDKNPATWSAAIKMSMKWTNLD